MVTIYPEMNQRSSTHIPPSPNRTQFARPARYMGPVLGSTPPVHFGDHHHHPQHFNPYHQALSNPCYFPPHGMHESVLREMEKQQIREEIIMSEILRRRVLEDEVRRELMMEREMDLRRGSNNEVQFGSSSSLFQPPPLRLPLLGTAGGEVPFGSSSSSLFIGSQPPPLMLPLLGTSGGERMPMEERIILSLSEKEKMLNGRSSEFGISPSSSVPGVKPVVEQSQEKRKTIILVNSDVEKPRGSKRKALDSNESEADGKKKAKEWFCVVCHISATSEHALEEHMKGKKHKSMEQRSGKNYSIGFSSKIDAKSVKACLAEPEFQNVDTNDSAKKDVSGVVVPKVQEKKNGYSKKKNLRYRSSGVVVPEVQEKNVDPKKNNLRYWSSGVVVPEVQENKNGDSQKKDLRYRCEICNVGSNSRRVMSDHNSGKKHAKRLEASERKA